MADMKLLKELRKITHAPLKDCKSALEEAGDDLEKAQQILREKGALKAAKKSDRETNEGVAIIRHIGDKTVGVKIACETDFVAKNDSFLAVVETVIERLSQESVFDTIADLSETTLADVDAMLKENFVKIGENMRLVDAFVLLGTSYIYLHPGNRVASVVFYDGDETAAKDTALQVAAMNPAYLTHSEVSPDAIAELTEMFKKEMVESGKPEAMHDQIIQGKIKKEYRSIVLLDQSSIVDDSQSVGKRLEAASTTVSKFIRYAI